MKPMLSLIFSASLAFAVVPASAQDNKETPDYMNCGAAGDACQPKEWQQYAAAANKAFPTWPEVGYRMYAAGCMDGNKALKQLCLTKPRQAAHQMKLDQ